MPAESHNSEDNRQQLLGNGSADTPVNNLWRTKHLSATAVTSRNNRRVVVDCVFCAVCAEAV
jgi:hypothetical protein